MSPLRASLLAWRRQTSFRKVGCPAVLGLLFPWGLSYTEKCRFMGKEVHEKRRTFCCAASRVSSLPPSDFYARNSNCIPINLHTWVHDVSTCHIFWPARRTGKRARAMRRPLHPRRRRRRPRRRSSCRWVRWASRSSRPPTIDPEKWQLKHFLMQYKIRYRILWLPWDLGKIVTLSDYCHNAISTVLPNKTIISGIFVTSR